MANDKLKNIDELDLESALKRLDEVVSGMSRQGVSLEDSLALYEEGVALVKLCNGRLESVERRISALRMTSDGEIVLEPFGGVAEG